MNEQSPIIAENRASGDENEDYQNEVRFGPLETFPHRYHESMLRALQMRRNFLWAETGNWLVNPPLLHCVALELGQTVRTAPDAWFPGQDYTGSDLQIHATNGDAVIRLVRVIKLQ